MPKRFPFFLDEVIDHEELWLIGNINEYILADITITGKFEGRGDVDVEQLPQVLCGWDSQNWRPASS